MTILPDGSFLAVDNREGRPWLQESTYVSHIRRYDADGFPDTSFGTNGAFKLTAGPGSTSAGGIEILADGRIAVSGSYRAFGPPEDPIPWDGVLAVLCP